MSAIQHYKKECKRLQEQVDELKNQLQMLTQQSKEQEVVIGALLIVHTAPLETYSEIYTALEKKLPLLKQLREDPTPLVQAAKGTVSKAYGITNSILG